MTSNAGSCWTTYDCNSSMCANVLGNSNKAPWYLASFVDPSAMFIWNLQYADEWAPSGVTVQISKEFYINTCHPCMNKSVALGLIYLCADDQVDIYLNGTLIASSQYKQCGSSNSISFLISAGKNRILFNAVNVGGAAGLIFAIYCKTGNSSILLMHSDGSFSANTLNSTTIMTRGEQNKIFDLQTNHVKPLKSNHHRTFTALTETCCCVKLFYHSAFIHNHDLN